MKRREKVGDSPETLMKNMPSELKQLGDAIKNHLLKQSRGDLYIAYAIGELVNTAINNEGIYGSDAVRQLAQYVAVPLGERALLDMAQVARSFKWTFLKGEIVKPMVNGQFLAWRHFLLVSRIASPKKLTSLLARIRAENLSLGELQDVISAAFETRHTRSGGRKLKSPSSPEAGLSRLAKNAHQFVKFEAILNEAVFSKLEEASSGDLDDCMLYAIESAEKATATAVKSMQHVLERLLAAKARVTQLLSEEEIEQDETDIAEDDEQNDYEEADEDEVSADLQTA
ncbi:MAG: hypothetical protein WCJ35_27305 [Planctomycetota bacterium]